MANIDPRIDAYIAKSPKFAQAILQHIHAKIHAHCPDAVETIKWNMPHFEYQGSIFCACAAFKQQCGRKIAQLEIPELLMAMHRGQMQI